MRKLTFAGCLVAMLTIFAQSAPAQNADARGGAAAPAVTERVPRLIQFSGLLKDGAARPVSGVASVTFAIYAEQDGGAALWTETQNVLADANGHYTALLGTASSGGFPAELIGTGQSRWLGVTIARLTESPRVLLASVPYALKAGDADTLGGLPASSYVTEQELAASNARPATTFLIGGTTVAAASGAATPGVAAGPTAAATTDAAQSVIQTNPTGSGTTNFIPLWTSGSNLGNSILFESGSRLGLGTTSPASTLDINGGEILRGGFYEFPEDTATATNGGRPSHSFQWLASGFNNKSQTSVDVGFGFRAEPLANNTPAPAAKLDLLYGVGGPTGSLAETGLSIAQNGVINFVPGQAFNGIDASLTGAVSASELNVGSGFVAAGTVIADTRDSDQYAVEAINLGPEAFAMDVDGTEVGLFATGGTFAAEFEGNVSVSGTLSKTAGSFKIDHPLDPANKYLYHSFVESPDMKNIYDGVVTTDANGFATVAMPDWFEALNRDFRYQLTTLGQPAQTWIAKKIANGQFTIQTDKPNVEVSWQITGIRQDAYANAHRIPVEADKSDAEKGHYIHPELFGHPEEVGIGAMRPGPDGKLVPIMTKPPQSAPPVR